MKNENLVRAAATGGKLLLVALAALALMFRVTGDGPSAARFSEMTTAVLSAADLAPMSLGDNQMLRRIYGLDPEALEDAVLYYPTSSMSAEELLLVKFSGDGEREQVRKAMEDRVASQLASFTDYAPEQAAMLERAIVDVEDNYALLISAVDPERVRQAFLDTY